MVGIALLAVGDLGLQELLLLGQHLHGILRLPLEGGEGLRDKAGNTDGDLRRSSLLALGILIILVHHTGGKGGNALDILIGLGRQAVHKIQLYVGLAPLKGHVHRAHEILLAHVFVDDVAQSLGTCLGGEGERRGTHRGNAVHQLLVEAIHAERRQRQADHVFIRPIQQ